MADITKKTSGALMKTLIVAALILAVGVAVYAKNQKNEQPPAAAGAAPTEGTAPAAAQPQASAPVAPLPRLVDLGAGKCIPCKMMAPILEELKKSHAGAFEVVFIDVWENKEEAKKYGIEMIPTQIFFDAAGKERFRHQGFYSKEDILAKWKELGVEVGAPLASEVPVTPPAAPDARAEAPGA